MQDLLAQFFASPLLLQTVTVYLCRDFTLSRDIIAEQQMSFVYYYLFSPVLHPPIVKVRKIFKKWRINEPITYSESASLWWKYFDAEKVRYTEVLVSSEIPEVLFVKLTIQSFTEIIIFLTGSCWS